MSKMLKGPNTNENAPPTEAQASSIAEPESVRQVCGWLPRGRNPTYATAKGVVNPTQGLPARNCPLKLDEKQFDEKLKNFSYLCRTVIIQVNVDNLWLSFRTTHFSI